MSTSLLSLYHRLQRWPAGSWLFSRAVCFKAPYFASIAPRITRLEHGRCEGTLADRRSVRNHIGTVHAIAMCNLAELTAGTGVTVNAVLPGPTRSEGVSDFFAEMAKEQGVSQDEMERDFIAQHRPTSLLRRLATVDEVANMVVYACSTQASATNGAALRVDGGVVRSIL